MTIAISHTKTFLAIRTMIEAGWFLDKTLSEIDEHLQFIQSNGHITTEEQQTLFDIAKQLENRQYAAYALE
jgi:hypothetical protein